MNTGTYYNRELPVDGEALRANSAVKAEWNKDGAYVELAAPPPGHKIWQELHAIRVKNAGGGDVPYREELLFWEGPAASKVYEIDAGTPNARPDDWYLAGGGTQQQMSFEELQVLKREGFISERKKTNFVDFDPEVGDIVPKDGPFFEVIPLDQAVPAAGANP